MFLQSLYQPRHLEARKLIDIKVVWRGQRLLISKHVEIPKIYQHFK